MTSRVRGWRPKRVPTTKLLRPDQALLLNYLPYSRSLSLALHIFCAVLSLLALPPAANILAITLSIMSPNSLTHHSLKIRTESEAIQALFLVESGVLPACTAGDSLRGSEVGHGAVFVWRDDRDQIDDGEDAGEWEWDECVERYVCEILSIYLSAVIVTTRRANERALYLCLAEQGLRTSRLADENSTLWRLSFTARRNTPGRSSSYWHIRASLPSIAGFSSSRITHILG